MPRIEVTQDMAKAAAMAGWEWFQKKVQEKGDLSFSGPHEAYGVILEEFRELEEAVRSNTPSKVWDELRDLFVPCVFELAFMDQQKPALDRIKISETSALRVVTALQLHQVGNLTNISSHDILGCVGITIGKLESTFYEDFALQLENLAKACLLGIASIQAGKMDW